MTEPTLTKGKRTRAEIIAVAYQLFVSQGYHGTSMRSIADNTGLAVGALYKHFPSKEDLFKVVLRERHPFNRMLPLLAQVEGETIEVLLRNAIKRMVTELEHDAKPLNLVAIELIEFDGRHLGELAELYLPHVLGFLPRLYTTRGQLRAVPPVALFRSMLSVIFMYFVSNPFLLEITPFQKEIGTLDDLIDNFLYGVIQPGETT